MSDLVGNPEDTFSHDAAQLILRVLEPDLRQTRRKSAWHTLGIPYNYFVQRIILITLIYLYFQVACVSVAVMRCGVLTVSVYL